MPTLIPEFEYYATLAADDIGAGPFGHRTIFNITGGKFHDD